jgi:NADPH:quinone reductase-like Zn-dependent oxidoreductase
MSGLQTALVVRDIGQPLVAVHDRLIPQPGPNEILVKLTVASLNPHDQYSRDRGLFIQNDLPAILTNDAVGRVIELGPGVTSFSKGDRVVSQSSLIPGHREKGLQQYAIFQTGHTSHIPDTVSDDEAATLPTNLITAVITLFDKSALGFPAPWTTEASTFDYGAQTILIIGGGGNCGKFGVQMAKLANIGKIIVVGGNETELKAFGATHVLDRHLNHDLLLAKIKEVAGDHLIYVYDTVNLPEGQLLGLNALSSSRKGKFARLVTLFPVDETKIVGKAAGYEIVNISGFSFLSPDLCEPFWIKLPSFLKEGKVKPLNFVVVSGLDAEKINHVLDQYSRSERITKTNVHI